MIEPPYRRIDSVETFDQRLVELPDRAIVEERAAAFVEPRAGNGGDTQGCMHLRGTVAAAREAIAKTEERTRRFTDDFSKRLDLRDRHAANR